MRFDFEETSSPLDRPYNSSNFCGDYRYVGGRRETARDKIPFSCTYLRCFETNRFSPYVHKSIVLLCPLVCSAR